MTATPTPEVGDILLGASYRKEEAEVEDAVEKEEAPKETPRLAEVLEDIAEQVEEVETKAEKPAKANGEGDKSEDDESGKDRDVA